jgi:hypothetical protein
MEDPSHFHSPKVPTEGGPASDLAEAADIPRPPDRVLTEELAAQARRKDLENFGTLPRNLLEAVLLIQAMEREGKRVHRGEKTMMNFLKSQSGDNISADLLAAMAMVMESISKRGQLKEESSLRFLLNRIRKSLWALFTRIANAFYPK